MRYRIENKELNHVRMDTIIFFEKLKIVEINRLKLDFSYGKVSKMSLVYTGFFPQFLIFQKNNNAET